MVFNNTRPRFLQYSWQALEDDSVKTLVEISSKELVSIDKSLMATPPTPPGLDEDDEEESPLIDLGAPRLQKTELLHHIKVTKPGVIQLERAGEGADVDIRVRMGKVTIVECPSAKFVDRVPESTRCIGAAEDLALGVFGVPPLALTWTRKVGSKTEEFVVEGIEGRHKDKAPDALVAREINIPLAVALDKLGTHTYTLDTIRDAVGNSVALGSKPNIDTTRGFAVLRRPEVSFANCAGGRPVGLRKGQSASLRVKTHGADQRDAPWSVIIRGPKGSTQTLQMDKNEKNLEVREEGDWTIMDVQGKFCAGDVLSPETCRVAQVLVPSAEVKWEKIREWCVSHVSPCILLTHCSSGDTGVSADLVLHGTPPFTVTWTSSYEGRPETTHTRKFDGSRGAFTLQPEHSGTYKYAFTKLADANYEDIKLPGPSVELNVHPVAGAKLLKGKSSDVYSCTGGDVDIDVELKVNGAWTLPGLELMRLFRVPRHGSSRCKSLVQKAPRPFPSPASRTPGPSSVFLFLMTSMSMAGHSRSTWVRFVLPFVVEDSAS